MKSEVAGLQSWSRGPGKPGSRSGCKGTGSPCAQAAGEVSLEQSGCG